MIRSLLLAGALALGGCSVARPAGVASIPPPPAFAPTDTAVARTEASLARIAALNPRLHAVIATDPTALDQARRLDATPGARGPLFGMPILIKDNIETAGPLPTTAGSLALLNNVTNRDAPLVARLRAAGAVIVGKANLSEWANFRSNDSISGWSAVGGQTRNPYALDRNACGSSTGSAVAVAAGMVPLAIGTETNGSITCPAALNGLVGFKPTVGLVSRTHVVPISETQDTPGPITRTVTEAAQVMDAIAGTDPADAATAEADARRQPYAAMLNAESLRGRRIGVMRFATGFGTNAVFEQALADLRTQGAVLVDIAEFPARAQMNENSFTVLLHEFRDGLNRYLATTPPSVTTRTLAQVIAFNREHASEEMPLFTQDLFEQAEATGGLTPAYRRARETAQRLAGPEGIDRMMREHNLDILVGPTMPAAWQIDAVNGDVIAGGGGGGLAAIAGYPHLTVPMGNIRGLPVGISFIGRKWADALVLSVGYAYEQASHRRIEPRFLDAIEDEPEIRRAFEPARR
ncbi:MAG: amidase [Sphingomonadales bacterium]|nr:amidase [Sphingomonadales bacterium]